MNIGFNLFIPILILKKGEAVLGIGPETNLLLALAFPVLYFIFDWIKRKNINFFSVLGFASILATGGIGLLGLDTKWFAIKEAAIPAVIGLCVVGSLKTKSPLVRTFLMNPSVLDVGAVERELTARNNHASFEKLLKSCSWLLGLSFLISAILNYVLAKMIVKSPGGTPEFNSEVGTMTWLSYIIIMIPCMAIMMFAMFKIFKGIKEHTGLEMEDIMYGAKKEEPTEVKDQPKASKHSEAPTTEPSANEASTPEAVDPTFPSSEPDSNTRPGDST